MPRPATKLKDSALAAIVDSYSCTAKPKSMLAFGVSSISLDVEAAPALFLNRQTKLENELLRPAGKYELVPRTKRSTTPCPKVGRVHSWLHISTACSSRGRINKAWTVLSLFTVPADGSTGSIRFLLARPVCSDIHASLLPQQIVSNRQHKCDNDVHSQTRLSRYALTDCSSK